MKKLVLSVLVIIISGICGINDALSQEKNIKEIENYLRDVEKRVSVLEKRVDRLEGRKQSAPQNRVSIDIPLEVNLLRKELVKAENAWDDEKIGFLLEFVNNGAKNITELEGTVVLLENSGDTLIEFGITVDEQIASGGSASWFGGIPFEKGDSSYRRVKNLDSGSIKASFIPEKVVFLDGSVLEK